jgi:MYXO-CTERM domain-containing protein
VNRPFGGGGGQWYWNTSATTNGSVGLWQNPGGGFGAGTGLQPNGALNGGNSADWAWTLEGDKVPAPGALALLGLAGLAGRRRR